MQLDTPGKINLYLDVLRRRGDGYHDLDTVFLALDWRDVLGIELAGGPGGVHPVREFATGGPHAAGVPCDESNLVWKACELFAATVEGKCPAINVHLTKNLPHGGGLGAGSSNAAHALRSLNSLAGSPLSEPELALLASQLGSDCAFFLGPPAAHATGRGEVLTPIAARALPVLMVLPGFPIPTASAYGALEPADLGPRSDKDAVIRWLADPGAPPPTTHNSFEAPLAASNAPLAEILAALRHTRPLIAHLSGSGSACFAIYDSLASRDAAAAQLTASGHRVVATETLASDGPAA